jgi:hypothetical protein
METDDIVQQVRQAREDYCRQFGFDLSAIVRDLRMREKASGRRIVVLDPRKPRLARSAAIEGLGFGGHCAPKKTVEPVT